MAKQRFSRRSFDGVRMMVIGCFVLVTLLQICGASSLADEGTTSQEADDETPTLATKFMQFNIRVDNIADWRPCSGRSWNHEWCPTHEVTARKNSFAAAVAAHNPSVFATEEGLYEQVDDTTAILSDKHNLDYAHVGIGRYGAGIDSETSTLFYKYAEWMVEATGNFMFSETPTVLGSYYDGASYAMISTWAVLDSRLRDGRRFLAVATHLDPYNPHVRAASAKQLRATVQDLLNKYSCKYVVLLGDFNSGFSEEPYKIITEYLTDSFKAANANGGPTYPNNSFTYHSFIGPKYKPEGIGPLPGHPNETLSDPDSPVDFMFFQKDTAQSVDSGSFSVDKSQFDGIWPSDHYPLIGSIEMPVHNRHLAYSWERVAVDGPLPPNSVSSGSRGFVGRHIPTGIAGDLFVLDGKVQALRVQGQKEAESSKVMEALVLQGGATVRWVPVKTGDDVPFGAVFSGFNSHDWNGYVTRLKLNGKYETCKVTSDGKVLGKLDRFWCWSSSYLPSEEGHEQGEILVITNTPTTVHSTGPVPAKQDAVSDKAELINV